VCVCVCEGVGVCDTYPFM